MPGGTRRREISLENVNDNANIFAKAFTFIAVPGMIAGAVATGPVTSLHHPATFPPPGAAYGLMVSDHVDPNHVDPDGSFPLTAIPQPGTAATAQIHLIPGD